MRSAPEHLLALLRYLLQVQSHACKWEQFKTNLPVRSWTCCPETSMSNWNYSLNFSLVPPIEPLERVKAVIPIGPSVRQASTLRSGDKNQCRKFPGLRDKGENCLHNVLILTNDKLVGEDSD